MASISLRNICKSFGRRDVLVNVNMEVADREFIVLLGPSGCGKTTLLNIIAGLEMQTKGDISVDGTLINGLSPGERDVGFVFQNYALYPNKSVYDNLAFSLSFKKPDAKEFEDYNRNGSGMHKREMIDRRVREVAHILRMEDFLGSKPSQLSGGQRQRVAMGRAMVRKPRMYLFDEPLSNLDAILRTSVREEIKEIHRRVATTMVYVTHDQVEAMTLADRMAVMNGGRILQIGSPREIYEKPSCIFVARFVGTPSMNLFRTRVVEMQEARLGFVVGGETIALPARLHQRFETLRDQELVFGVRPEDVGFVDRYTASCKIRAQVTDREFLGDSHVMHLSAGTDRFVVSTSDDQAGNVVRETDMYIDVSALHIFDANTESRL